jgi:ferric-dicitrate binding protein FerR (iron transport regulator)
MNDTFERIITLFRKAYLDTLTPGERQELDRFLKERHLQEVYDDLTRHELLKEALVEERLFPYQKALASFKRQTRRRHRRHRLYMASAAAVVLLLLAPVLFRTLLPGRVEPLAGNTIIPPGHGQASVRLASGEVITLSDRDLQVEEHGTRVTYEEGKIAYHSTRASAEPVMHELLVPPGGECRVILDDGTRVWVNADTKITYPVKFTGNERTILLEGEAYFEVTPDTRPFTVRARLGEITVLGTSFAIRAYPAEEMTATLVSGKILYTGRDTLALLPSEQVIASLSGEVTKRRVDIQEFTGWKEGLYVFNKRPLESIMTDLARWYNVTVSYRTPGLSRIAFSGYLKRYDNINSFLELLRETGEVDYTIRERHIVLLEK